MEVFDSIIVGGGIAGLQAAIQLGRYGHRIAVVDSENGRSTLCRAYHNVLGWPDGISGNKLRGLGRLHAERLGVHFAKDEVVQATQSEANEDGFVLTGLSGITYRGKTLLLATGIMDRFPDLPGLKPCLGLTVYVCPDCDGYEIKGRRTIVLGSGDVGANMALLLSYWTREIVYVNHERKQTSPEVERKLQEEGFECYTEEIDSVDAEGDGQFRGVILKNGQFIQGERGFIAFGGNAVLSGLAEQLGVERIENKHILTDPRSKMTNVPNVWAAGDVGVHAEQVTIAMGEGSQAAIWMHKALVKK